MKYYMLLISICSFFISCGIKKEIYILPDNFQGKVCVFYNQNINKGEFKVDGSAIIYYVPDDGVVFTNKVPEDITDIEYYYIGSKNAIDFVFSHDELSNKTVVYGGRKGWLTLKNNKEILYNSFYVGNRKTIDSIKKINSEEFLKQKYYSVINN